MKSLVQGAGRSQDGPPPPPEEGPPCDLCGAPMLERHCKLLCLSCGYVRDCSDP